MTEERKKKITKEFESKQEEIKKAINNRATYEKWDKHSSIWAYSYVFGKEKEIKNKKDIEYVLKQPRTIYVNYFFNKEDLETYKWMYERISDEIHNAIFESFNFDNFVDYKDLDLGDKAYVKKRNN